MNIWSHHMIGSQLEKLTAIFAALDDSDIYAIAAQDDVRQCMAVLRNYPAQDVALKMLAIMKSSADAGDRARLELQSSVLRFLIDQDIALDLKRSANLRACRIAHADISDYASNGM